MNKPEYYNPDLSNMHLVVGEPRSGTSLMMNLLRTNLGDNKIIGEKFNFRKYHGMFSDGATIDFAKDLANNTYNDKNPDGFWECSMTISGVNKLCGDKWIKIICKGLPNSIYIEYIDKVIFMIRNPASCIKSRNKLDGNLYSPEIWYNNVLKSVNYLIENNVDILFVPYENLIENSDYELNRISNFIGKDLQNTCIDKNLQRNISELKNNTATDLYLDLRDNNISNISKYKLIDNIIEIPKKTRLPKKIDKNLNTINLNKCKNCVFRVNEKCSNLNKNILDVIQDYKQCPILQQQISKIKNCKTCKK